MSMKTIDDLLLEELGELRAAEKHDADVLIRLADAAWDEELSRAFKTHADQTSEHVARLDRVFDQLGARPRRARRAETRGMRGLCADCLELADTKWTERHVRDAALIAAAQHIEHDEIAGYGCARAWASQLGHEGVADLLSQTLAEEHAADAMLSRLAERINRGAPVAMRA
ncbi:MAG: DUF892 family protein [Phycisphaeraceae bacterium]|nr:DUF892 family protein [Phycisphaeraceae bacterium]